MSNEPQVATPRDVESAPALQLDAVFDVLADGRRRTMLTVLADRRDATSVAELVEQTLADPTSDDDPNDDARTTLTIRCHHVHLPKLADAGLVRYDHEAKTVAPTPTLDHVVTHLTL